MQNCGEDDDSDEENCGNLRNSFIKINKWRDFATTQKLINLIVIQKFGLKMKSGVVTT